MVLLLGSLELGFIYGLLAIGIYISFRIMNIPDLTAEGSFTLGLVTSAALCMHGSAPAGILLSFVVGAAAGIVTALLQTKLKIHPVLAGIITMTGLYSINLQVNGQAPNVSLLTTQTVFKSLESVIPNKDAADMLLTGVITVIVLLILIWFFRTHLGLNIRATGDNEDMVSASSINVDKMKIIALAVSNGCIALSGGVLAQYQGYADTNSGAGTLVVGLASVIIGEAIFGRHGVTLSLLTAVGGAMVYRFIMAFAINVHIFPSYYLKFVSAVIVAIALAIPAIRGYINKRRIIAAAGREDTEVMATRGQNVAGTEESGEPQKPQDENNRDGKEDRDA